MCGAAALPVLKFIAPMVLPSLANKFFGGNKQQTAAPAFRQTAAPGLKAAGASAVIGEDEEARDETKAAETEQSKNQKLMRDRQKNQNDSTGAQTSPQTGVGSNIGGTGQQTGGITAPVAAAY